MVNEEAVSTNSWSPTARVPPPSQMGLFGTISTQRKSSKKTPRTVAQSSQLSAGDSSPSVSGVAMTTPLSPSTPLSNALFADAQYVMNSPAIESQNRKRMHRQSSSRSSCTLEASVWTFTAILAIITFMAFFAPSVVVSQSCPESNKTESPCTGLFHIRTSPVQMLDMTEGFCPWMAAKYHKYTAIPFNQGHQLSVNSPPPLDSFCGEMPSRICNR